MKPLLGAQDNWEVVQDGFIKPKNIVGFTNAPNNVLKAMCMKDKVALYILY